MRLSTALLLAGHHLLFASAVCAPRGPPSPIPTLPPDSSGDSFYYQGCYRSIGVSNTEVWDLQNATIGNPAECSAICSRRWQYTTFLSVLGNRCYCGRYYRISYDEARVDDVLCAGRCSNGSSVACGVSGGPGENHYTPLYTRWRRLEPAPEPGWEYTGCYSRISFLNRTVPWPEVGVNGDPGSWQRACQRANDTGVAMNNGLDGAYTCYCGLGPAQGTLWMNELCTVPCIANESAPCGSQNAWAFWTTYARRRSGDATLPQAPSSLILYPSGTYSARLPEFGRRVVAPTTLPPM